MSAIWMQQSMVQERIFIITGFTPFKLPGMIPAVRAMDRPLNWTPISVVLPMWFTSGQPGRRMLFSLDLRPDIMVSTTATSTAEVLSWKPSDSDGWKTMDMMNTACQVILIMSPKGSDGNISESNPSVIIC